MHHPSNRIAHTITFVETVVECWLEREIDQPLGSVHDEQIIYRCPIENINDKTKCIFS